MSAGRPGSRLMEMVAWLGLLLGLASLATTAWAGPPRELYAARALPTPQEITAYATAICSAVTVAFNTAFIIWHKCHPARPRKRKRKRSKPDEDPPPDP